MKTKNFTANCLHCDKEYQAIRSTSLYCSASCRQMVYAKRANQRYKKYLEERNASMQAQNTQPVTHTVNSPSYKEVLALFTKILDRHLASE